MRYYVKYRDGLLYMLGTGLGGEEISAERYNELHELLVNTPTDAPAGYEYRINEQDEYVLVEVEPAPEPEPTPDEALTRYANELTGENDPDLVSATETLITKF